MGRHISLAAFFATVLVVVPAGWRALDADIPSDGPAARPKQQVLHTGGASVAIDLDRGVMMAGGKLKVSLVATADTTKKISLEVRALEDNGVDGERVSRPPTVVGKRRITIEAAPGGGKPTEVTFQLGSKRAKGTVQWFDVDVTAVGKKGDDTDEGSEAATAGVAVWSGNTFGMTIESQPNVPADGPFKVAVRVKNTTKKPMDWLQVDVGGSSLGYSGMEGLTMYNGGDDAEFEVTADDRPDDEGELQPGQQREFDYTVTPKHAGLKTFTLVAHANGGNPGRGGGALDVITIRRPASTELPQPAVALSPEALKAAVIGAPELVKHAVEANSAAVEAAVAAPGAVGTAITPPAAAASTPTASPVTTNRPASTSAPAPRPIAAT